MRTRTLAASAVVLAVVMSASACEGRTTQAAAGEPISVCVRADDGAARFVADGIACRDHETAMTVVQGGPAGPGIDRWRASGSITEASGDVILGDVPIASGDIVRVTAEAVSSYGGLLVGGSAACRVTAVGPVRTYGGADDLPANSGVLLEATVLGVADGGTVSLGVRCLGDKGTGVIAVEVSAVRESGRR